MRIFAGNSAALPLTIILLLNLFGFVAQADIARCNRCISWCNVNSGSDEEARACLDRCLAQNFCQSSSPASFSQGGQDYVNDGIEGLDYPEATYRALCEKGDLQEAVSNGNSVLKALCVRWSDSAAGRFSVSK